MPRTRFAEGDLVSPSDRENFGTICAENSDGTYDVHFVSPTGHEATIPFSAEQLRPAGSPKGKTADRNGNAPRRNGQSHYQTNGDTTATDTELPQDETAEGMVVFSFLKFDYAQSEIAETVSPEKFYSARNKLLMERGLGLHSRGKPVEFESIGIELRDRGELDDKMIDYLAINFHEIPTGANWRYYWEIVATKFALREIIYNAASSTARGQSPQG